MKSLIVLALLFLAGCTAHDTTASTQTQSTTVQQTQPPQQTYTARIGINGDVLYHGPLIQSGKTGNNSYDFSKHYEHIEPLISSFDFAIANFEGSINPKLPYSGYPRFNIPPQIAKDLKEVGYDGILLANNHIADSGLDGILATYQTFADQKFYVFGTNPNPNAAFYIISINGIKVAFLNYSDIFNGMEHAIPTDKKYLLYDMNRDRIKNDITLAEKNADFTIVMPHMGDEYHLAPNARQKTLYHDMISWGADAVVGNHPHVTQPTEIVEKDGHSKFILYSMGNFISNQSPETLGNTMNSHWTNRSVIVELNVKKEGENVAVLDTVKLHPTYVHRQIKNTGIQYAVLPTEDYLNDAKHLDATTHAAVKKTHQDMLNHLNLKPFKP